nr:hypothetical protein CFP56_47687 [Quercus suber]
MCLAIAQKLIRTKHNIIWRLREKESLTLIISMKLNSKIVQQENDEDLTLLHRDGVPAIDLGDLIPVDDVYVQLDESTFINNDLSNEEWDTDSNNEEETYNDDDVSSSDQEKDLSSNDESIGDLGDED